MNSTTATQLHSFTDFAQRIIQGSRLIVSVLPFAIKHDVELILEYTEQDGTELFVAVKEDNGRSGVIVSERSRLLSLHNKNSK